MSDLSDPPTNATSAFVPSMASRLRRIAAYGIGASLVIAVTLTGFVTRATASEVPAMFSELPYTDASAKAVKEDRLLILDFMAEWCGPCKQMDKTTWIDQRVVDWVASNAIAIQVDVDKDRTTASKFQIQAMPTIVLVRAGEEFDRVVGYRTADEMLAWLTRAESGEKTVDPQAVVDQRYQDARQLLAQGDFEEATKEYVWLWKNAPSEGPVGDYFRHSVLMMDMSQLLWRDQDARPVIGALRDETETAWKEKTESDLALFRDWVTLNVILQDAERIITWYDGAKDSENIEAMLAPPVDGIVFGMLIERERWAEAGGLLTDPVQQLRSGVDYLETLPDDVDESTLRQMRQMFFEAARHEVATRYAACLAAERDELAGELAAALIGVHDTPEARIALVTRALDAEETREGFDEWLNEAEETGKDVDALRKRLAETRAAGADTADESSDQ